MNKLFTSVGWEEYIYWQTEDRKILKKINNLLKDIERNGNEGLGKPEPLKHESRATTLSKGGLKFQAPSRGIVTSSA